MHNVQIKRDDVGDAGKRCNGSKGPGTSTIVFGEVEVAEKKATT